MLNLKLKLPLLALSISTALIAPQIVSAVPINILPLGDSITNGYLNEGDDDANGNSTPGTKLSYRDDLYDLLKSANIDFKFIGSCPEASDGNGECNAVKPNHDGKVLKHEGRASYEAGDIVDNIDTWFGSNYLNGFPDVALIHVGTNDIFNGKNPTDTRNQIKKIVGKLLKQYLDMKIYVAKILPIGGGATDAAIPLNDLLTQEWSNTTWPQSGVKIVDMNKGISLNTDYFIGDLIHPRQKTEAIMAQRWFDAAFGNGEPADPSTSSLTANKTTISADNKDSAIITLDAKDASGNNLSNPSIEFIINNTDETKISLTPSVKNSDGTYSVSLKNNNYLETLQPGGAVVVVKVNGVTLKRTDGATAYVLVKFLTGQTITFNPPSTMAYAEEKVMTDNVKSLKFGTTTPTNLKVLVEVDPTSSAICKIDAANKLVIKSTAKKDDVCKLNASQAGGTENGVTYGAAATVPKEITVVRANQTITFDANTPSTGFIGEVFTVKAVSISGLNVAFTATPSNVCSIDGNAKVTLKATGTCKVTASQAGNAQYKVAPLSFANITVSNDKVTLPTIADKTFGVKPFAVTAKSSAGAVVTLTATPAKVCTVSGKTVTVVGAGTCKLTAKTAHGEDTTTFTVKKNASQLAIDVVAKVINGSGSITVAQLEPIKGLKNLKKGRDYTKALKAGTYADKRNPAVAELQKAVDKANSDANKSGGSTSPLWLLTLGFVALFRRKAK